MSSRGVIGFSLLVVVAATTLVACGTRQGTPQPPPGGKVTFRHKAGCQFLVTPDECLEVAPATATSATPGRWGGID